MVTQTQVSCLIFLFYLESQIAVSGHFGYTRNLIPFSKKKKKTIRIRVSPGVF